MENMKCVFFDMGNTLLHFHYGKTDDEKDMLGLEHLTNYLKKFNNNITFERVKREFYEVWMEGIKDRRERFVEYPIEDFLRDFLIEYKVDLELKQCIEAINIFYTEYREELYLECETIEVLKKLRDKGKKIGVISNTCYYDEVMVECFKKAKLYDLIDSFTFSYSLRLAKPKKEIFKKAMETMKVLPSEAIMIGDSIESDIRPAKELGMKTIWLNSKSECIEGKITPNIQVSSISEVLKYI